MNFINLSVLDVAAVSIFVLLNGLLSLWLSLGIERQLLVATVRMVVQLSTIGAVLTLLFSAASLPWTLTMALVMVLLAGREIAARQKRPLKGWWGYGLGTATMTLAAATLTLVALLGSLQPEPWFDPRYAIPLFGMILGNAMIGISLGLDTLNHGCGARTSGNRSAPLPRRHPNRGAASCHARSHAPWLHAHDQCDGCRRHRLPARHDDRIDTSWRGAWRGRALPAPDHVSDLGSDRPGSPFGRAGRRPAPHR